MKLFPLLTLAACGPAFTVASPSSDGDTAMAAVPGAPFLYTGPLEDAGAFEAAAPLEPELDAGIETQDATPDAQTLDAASTCGGCRPFYETACVTSDGGCGCEPVLTTECK